MWSEPLTATAVQRHASGSVVTVTDGSGTKVAHVICAYSIEAHSAYYGSMQIDDQSGTTRQKMRAFVLMTREALRHAEELGLVTVETDAPPALRAFAGRMTGLQHVNGSIRGDLAAVRSHALNASDADGNET